ncbi:MAG: hypothetical protein U0L66_02960 [Acutalibacteraceae bacterium]|nr:hypothetical protein [Acutalibacteraceae bacterium]
MKKKYHVVLTPDEPEIIAFKKSLPQGELSKTVATIMTESLKDKVATIPMNFEIEPVTKDVHTKMSLPEELVQRFCKKFGCKKGNLTTAIKSEIKKCIRKNLSFEPDRYFSSAKVNSIFGQVINRVSQKKNSLDAGGERSRSIEKEWLNAFYAMQKTVNEKRNENNE